MKIWLHLTFSLFLMLSPNAHARVDESGPGNGTDYVKVLFADAQYEVLRSLMLVTDRDVNNLEVDPAIRIWLLESTQSTSRLEKLKYYLRRMDLTFQQGPCSDDSGKPATICYFNDAEGPYVRIALEENRWTTKDQAMAMLIHEAGHFTGETNHIYLDKVGIQMVNALQKPRLLFGQMETEEIAINIFTAKDQCEAGTSTQAQLLKKEAQADLRLQCASRKISCDIQKAEFIFRGTIQFRPGIGFDTKVKCACRYQLPL